MILHSLRCEQYYLPFISLESLLDIVQLRAEGYLLFSACACQVPETKISNVREERKQHVNARNISVSVKIKKC